MSALIYLSCLSDDVVFGRDFQFIVLHNGLGLLSDSTYRLLSGQLADMVTTEKQVAASLLDAWLHAVERDLASSVATFADKDYELEGVSSPMRIAGYLRPDLQRLAELLEKARKHGCDRLISCCV